MKFVTDPTEQEIFNALISREPKFKVKCLDFDESHFQKSVLDDLPKVRERKCKAYAKKLTKLVEQC